MCVRLRRNGGRILRIDADMAWHDANINLFSEWWKREIRNGHAYAQGVWLHGLSRQRHWVRESLRSWFWALFLPVLAVIGLFPSKGLSVILLLTAYAVLGFRVFLKTQNKGFNYAFAKA